MRAQSKAGFTLLLVLLALGTVSTLLGSVIWFLSSQHKTFRLLQLREQARSHCNYALATALEDLQNRLPGCVSLGQAGPSALYQVATQTKLPPIASKALDTPSTHIADYAVALQNGTYSYYAEDLSLSEPAEALSALIHPQTGRPKYNLYSRIPNPTTHEERLIQSFVTLTTDAQGYGHPANYRLSQFQGNTPFVAESIGLGPVITHWQLRLTGNLTESSCNLEHHCTLTLWNPYLVPLKSATYRFTAASHQAVALSVSSDTHPGLHARRHQPYLIALSTLNPSNSPAHVLFEDSRTLSFESGETKTITLPIYTATLSQLLNQQISKPTLPAPPRTHQPTIRTLTQPVPNPPRQLQLQLPRQWNQVTFRVQVAEDTQQDRCTYIGSFGCKLSNHAFNWQLQQRTVTLWDFGQNLIESASSYLNNPRGFPGFEPLANTHKWRWQPSSNPNTYLKAQFALSKPKDTITSVGYFRHAMLDCNFSAPLEALGTPHHLANALYDQYYWLSPANQNTYTNTHSHPLHIGALNINSHLEGAWHSVLTQVLPTHTCTTLAYCITQLLPSHPPLASIQALADSAILQQALSSTQLSLTQNELLEHLAPYLTTCGDSWRIHLCGTAHHGTHTTQQRGTAIVQRIFSADQPQWIIRSLHWD